MFRLTLLAVSLLLTPVGIAAEDDWKAEANARIEAIRKRDASIVFVDEFGTPIPDAAISAGQTRHHFAFGTEIGMSILSNEDYWNFFMDHFEWAVFGNESKWFMNEPYRDFETYSRADAMLDKLELHGIPVRGHCLFWAKEQFTPAWSRSLPPEELSEEVDERIDHGVEHFRGRFLHWDINNEMLDGHFFEERLGPEIRPHMFTRSHGVDPDALLFTNDYNIIAGSVSRTNRYISQIQGLLDAGAPVHAIGVQGHFWGDTVDPLAILDRLDRLSVLGLPIWITEYDTEDADDVARGEKLENCYRAAFSHPSVEGILMWGFWAEAHWRGPNAAIVDEDWTLNAAGVKYEQLMNEWTTLAEGATGVDGRFAFRGFHGEYALTITPPDGSDPIDVPLTLHPDAGPLPVLVPQVPGSCFPAAEVPDLLVSHHAANGSTELSWAPLPARTDGMGLSYDVLRSDDPSDFDLAAECLESGDGSDTRATDPDVPVPSLASYYLVRGAYACPDGAGPVGSASNGTPRAARPCP